MKGRFRCEWCGDFRGGNHRERCPDNPRVHAETMAALDDGTGHIRLSQDYKNHCAGGMVYSTLWKRYGSWAHVAAAPQSALDRAIDATWDDMEAEMAANRALRFECGAFRM
jgi:hypothetical protein